MSTEHIDLDCVDDLTPSMDLVDGSSAVKQSIARRILTLRGRLWYDQGYGFDVRRLLNAPMTRALAWRIRKVVHGQAMADERVLRATVRSEWYQRTSILKIYLSVTTTEGTVPLTLEISDISVKVLGLVEATG